MNLPHLIDYEPRSTLLPGHVCYLQATFTGILTHNAEKIMPTPKQIKSI